MRNKWVRWGVYLLVALLFAAACVVLSKWQLDRNEWRAGQNALIENNYDSDPVALADVLTSEGEFDPATEWQSVQLRGEYLHDEQLLVRNRPHGGTNAFEVVIPFRTDSGEIVLVNRGWIVAHDGPVPETIPAPAEGEIEIVVRMKPTEPLPASGRTAPEGQIPTIHVPTVAAAFGDEMISDAYGQLVRETPAAAASLGGFETPSTDPGPHLSYAIQWVLFAIMGFAFIGYMIRTEVIAAREEREGAPRVRKKKRRDVDADAEDALLEG